MRTVKRAVRRQDENTERLYFCPKNEAELAGLKEPDEDSKTLYLLDEADPVLTWCEPMKYLGAGV
jgi:hypothetical protein